MLGWRWGQDFQRLYLRWVVGYSEVAGHGRGHGRGLRHVDQERVFSGWMAGLRGSVAARKRFEAVFGVGAGAHGQGVFYALQGSPTGWAAGLMDGKLGLGA